ncbi:MAG: serine/threonine protein kinase [Actinoallomurus sp.]|nr:serine/threonine protein kinase [Actinoallomurus sp.]
MDPLQAEDPRRIRGYQLLGRLGAGGMGTVYLGRSPAGLPVAIKVVHAELAEQPSFRTRFAREVAAARAVSGAFTAPVIDADPNASSPWLVTGYLPGMTLHEAVVEYGPFPVPAVFALGASLAEALVSIHRAGVVHRDLKPANVILAPDGPRLIDFGIAHTADAAVVTRAGHLIGSPGFLAPEQAVGGATGPASDVFAFGAVLTFAATGEGPFGRGTAPALVYRVVHDAARLEGVTDPGLRAVIAACLRKDPLSRPYAAWLLEQLSTHAPAVDVLHGTGWLPDGVALRIAERAPVLPGPDRRRFLVIGGGAVAALAAGGAVVAALARTGEARPGVSTAPSLPPIPSPTPTATPADAQQRWSRDIGTDPYGGIAVASGILCVSGDQGRLYGLDAASGRQRWRHTVSGRGAGAATWRTPVISGRGLYVGWPAKDGVLYAFDVVTGRERWRYQVAFDARTPVASGGLVYIGDGDGILHAVDAATGAVRWRRSIGGVLSSRPFTAGGVLYADTTKALYALDARTGRTRWRRAMAGGAVGPTAAAGLVFCANGQAELFALRAGDGAQRWTFTGGTSVGTPYVAGGTVYVADGSGNMNALDAATGGVRWRCETGEQDVGRASMSDGMACFTAKSDILGVEPATGQVRWRRTIGGEIRADTVASGVYYVASETGRLYAFTAKGV